MLFYNSRYAERLPIGKPEIIRNAPAARLRAFYDTWYRPDRMAVVAVGDIDPQQIEQTITDAVRAADGARARRAGARSRRCRCTSSCWSASSTDPEVTQSNVQIVRKRPREGEQRVADYRRDLVAAARSST